MFYRQKVLLALLQSCGGDLGHTDLEKLLFLYCQVVDRNYYDFFPYRYGAFSFMSFYDKGKLEAQGLLKRGDRFVLASRRSFREELEVRDRAAMRAFVKEYAQLRGRSLIIKSYLDYPEYAARSEISAEILTPTEYDSVQAYWNTDISVGLFTIGYEGLTIDAYLCRLISNNVRMLIDVRMNPYSRKHGFSQKSLQSYLQKVDIAYLHLPELGIPSNRRKNLGNKESYENLFAYYSKEVLPNQVEALATIRSQVAEVHRVALTCFEAQPSMCHRSEIVTALKSSPNFEHPVMHI